MSLILQNFVTLKALEVVLGNAQGIPEKFNLFLQPGWIGFGSNPALNLNAMKHKPQLSIYFLIFSLFIFSCTGRDSIPTSYQLTESGEMVRIPLDTATSNLSDGLQFFPGETPLLFNLNWMENSIQIYDLTEKKKIKELKFDYEGPNGVLDIMGIYIHNLDSIFLFNQLVNQLTLIDTSGTIKSKITYEAPDQYSPAFIHNAYFKSPPILNGNKLVVKTHFYGQITSVTNDQLNEKELMYEIDLETGKTDFLGIKYPKDYLLGGFKLFEPSIAFGNGGVFIKLCQFG